MKGVGAKCGVKAEAIVFLDYFTDFPIHGKAGFAGLAKSFAGMSRSHDKKRSSTPAAESRARHEDGYLAAAPSEAPK